MNELTIDELKQLVVFYKQKASDLEYEVLKNQLLSNRTALVESQANTKTKKSE